MVVITNFTPAIPVFIASPSRRIPASSSATIVVRDFSVTPRERRAIKREARRQRARRHDEPLTSENLEKLNNEVNAYQKSQQELTGHPTNDNNDSRGDSPIGRTPPTPIIAPQANIPGFNNEGSYLVALRSISNLDLGAAVSTIPSASGSSPRQPLLRTQSVVKKCNNASQQLIAKNIAVVASVDHERRRPAREKAAKTANMLSELSADADKKYAEAEADSKKMKTTPYPSELAKIEEAARKERFRKKVPEFWW